jgi:hypothetical protein
MQTETPFAMVTKWPSDKTRTAPTTHCAVAQGATGGVNGHPNTAYGAPMVVMGLPDTNTRALN